METNLPPLNELDVVALIEPLSEHRLVRGQVGTVVGEWEPGAYEVEFSDHKSGQTIALVALPSAKLMRLHYTPIATTK